MLAYKRECLHGRFSVYEHLLVQIVCGHLLALLLYVIFFSFIVAQLEILLYVCM